MSFDRKERSKMASITSLSNSSYNTSSIYGNRNVLSGLASGMDTETMIENAVSGIKLKIQNLVKKRTKVEWQQEAYRSIIDKAVNFNTKYTSYSSKTNLLSQSFFSNAVNTAVNGTYKDKISASGKTNSDIKINAVKQMATAATYTVSGLGGQSAGEIASAVGGKEFNIGGKMTVNNVSGSLTFQYGGTNGATFDISFDELEDLDAIEVKNADGTVKQDPTNAEKLAQAINNKLKDVTYNYTKNGFREATTADKAVKVTANADGRIVFSDGLGNGNKVTISSATGKIKDVFDLTEDENNVIAVGSTALANHNMPTYRYLADKELSVSLNGVTKTIKMSDVVGATDVDSSNANESFMKKLQEKLDDAFGTDASGKARVTVSQSKDGKLSFTPSEDGDTVTLGGSAVKAMGFESGDSNYINTSKKLKDLAGDFFTNDNRLKPVGDVNTARMLDSAGNKVKQDDDGNYYRVNSDGKFIYDFEINGAKINVTEDITLERLMNAINSNPDAGVKASYSKLTNEFKFTATETGANGRIEFGGIAKGMFGDTAAANIQPVSGGTKLSDILDADQDYGSGHANFTMKVGDLAPMSIDVSKNTTIDGVIDQFNFMLGVLKEAGETDKEITASFDSSTNSIVFKDKDGDALEAVAEGGVAKNLLGKIQAPAGTSYTKGQDAVMDVEINGKRFENLTRSSNSFDIDGLTVNVKGTFEAKGKDGAAYDPVTFETTTDSDKIVEAIKSFVDDYNEMITEIKNAYSTLPAEKSNGNRYEPLTAEQEEEYSESELKAYNEKAKQGILFGDSTLSSMYSKMLNAIQPGGTDGQTLREIGIGTSYSSGLTTISLDEDKLRAALESDPDKVKNAFTKTREGGASSDGLMQTMQNTLNNYVKTTGEPKGVLITRAGSAKAPTSLNSNSLKSQIDSYDNQIDRWTDKMADQIDRYTTQFSRLEQLIAEMNSQASAMSGLMGGSSGY